MKLRLIAALMIGLGLTACGADGPPIPPVAESAR